MVSKSSSPAVLLIAAFVFSAFVLCDSHVVKASKDAIKDIKAIKATERIPAHCSLPINQNTAKCVCYLNFSNSPQFSHFTFAELSQGRQTCLASFSMADITSSTCNRFRQTPGSQNVNLYWLLGEANALISACAPGVPPLRYP